MLRSTAANVLLARLVLMANAAANERNDAVDELVDNYLGNLFSQGFKTPEFPASIQHADLDNVTLARPWPLAGASGAVAPLAGANRALLAPRTVDSLQLPRAGASGAVAPLSAQAAGLSPFARAGKRCCKAQAAVGTTYEIKQPKPIGISFKEKGGEIIVDRVDRNADPKVSVGDKLVAVSASFGGEIWPAKNYQQTMFAVSTRIGLVYLKLESRGRGGVFKKQANTPNAQYVCVDCGWIYNEFDGDTPFNRLPKDFACPQCQAGKRRFARKNMATGEVENITDFAQIGQYATIIVGLVSIGILAYLASTV